MADQANLNEEDSTILETRNISARLNKNVYSVFVDSKNMRSDMIIPVSNINSNQYVETSITSADSTVEKYSFLFNRRSIESRCMVRECDIQINYNGYACANVLTLNLPGAGLADEIGFMNLNSFNPFQPGIMNFVCDPLNTAVASSTVAFGSNNVGITTEYTPKLINILRKMDRDNVLNENYEGLLNPNSYCLLHKLDDGISDFPLYYGNIVNRDNGTVTANYYNITARNCSNFDLINDKASESNNKRSTIFNRAVYTFTKSLASSNWSYSKDNKQFTYVPNSTTTLYTMNIGSQYFPTNVQNWYDAVADVGYLSLMWYPTREAFNSTAGAAGQPPLVLEPPGQSLNVSIVLKGVKSPLINPLLQDLPKDSFSETQNAKIDLRLHTNLFARLLDFRTTNNIDITKGTLKLSNQKIYYRQYDVQMLEPYIKPIISIPYQELSFNGTPTTIMIPVRPALTNEQNYNFQEITFTQTIKMQASMANKFLWFLENLDYDIPYEIRSYSLSMNGGANVMLQTIDQLFEATRLNGLDLTLQDEHNNYNTIGNRKGPVRVPSSSQALLLSYGSNIPLPSDITAGMVNSNLNITISVKCAFNFPSCLTLKYPAPAQSNPAVTPQPMPVVLNPRFINISEMIYNIENDKVLQDTSLFTQTDLASVYKLTQEAISNNEWTTNKASLYGGGIHSRKHDKNNGVIPKLKKKKGKAPYQAPNQPPLETTPPNSNSQPGKASSSFKDMLRR